MESGHHDIDKYHRRRASLKALNQPFAQAQELSRVHNPVCIDAKHQHSGPQNLKSFINI